MAHADFYWISPKGEVIRPSGEPFHADLIIARPTLFGYKNKEEAIKFKNEHGGDNDALRMPAIATGYVRIRFRNDTMIIQLVEFNSTVKEHIRNFVRSEKVYMNVYFQMKNVAGDIVHTGRVIDFLNEDDIPNDSKRDPFPPRDTEEGRTKKREELVGIHFDDKSKYEYLAKGNFVFNNNVATVKEFADIDLKNITFSNIVTL